MRRSEAFKNQLKNYLFYKAEVERLNEEINLMYYDLANVKAIQYDKIPGSFDQSFMEQVKLEKLDDISKIENKINYYQSSIKYVDSVLNQMDASIREIAIDIYCKKKTYENQSSKVYMSTSGLFKRIEKELDRILK